MRFKFFSHHVHLPFVVLAVIEAAAMAVVGTLLLTALGHGDDPAALAKTVALLVALTITLMVAFGMFSRRMRERTAGVALRIALAVTIGAVATWVALRLAEHADWIDLADLLVMIPVGVFVATGVRFVFARLLDEDVLRPRVIVFGSGTRAETIAGLRRRADQRGFKLMGFVQPEGERSTIAPERLLRDIRPLSEIADALNIDEIVVAMDDRRRSFPVAELLECRLSGVDITEVVTFLERETGRVRLDVLHPSWLIYSEGFRRHVWRRVTQRIFDLIAGTVLFALTWPLMLLTMLAIKLEDGWRAPVIYRQRRTGFLERPFDLLKFRSMRIDAERDGVAQWAMQNDARVTRVGSVIRRIRFDELPQLINVIKGEMSFVGPRPERPEFVEQLSQRIPYYRERHWVKPGITGWAQICYPYGASEQDAIEKLQYDLYYVKNHTLLFDLMILLQTIETILLSRGAR